MNVNVFQVATLLGAPGDPGDFPKPKTDPLDDLAEYLPPWPLVLIIIAAIALRIGWNYLAARQRDKDAAVAADRNGDNPVVWSYRDESLLTTCRIWRAAVNGRADEIPALATYFAPELGDRERLWVRGGGQVSAWIAPGDGQYERRSGGLFIFHPIWLAIMPVLAAGRAIGNYRRKQQAVSDLEERWLPVDQVALWVGSHGFYLEGTTIRSFGWSSIQSVQMVGAGAATIRYLGADGRNQVMLVQSEWAELIFIGWAVVRHPAHPALAGTDTWLPPGWVTKAEQWANGELAVAT